MGWPLARYKSHASRGFRCTLPLVAKQPRPAGRQRSGPASEGRIADGWPIVRLCHTLGDKCTVGVTVPGMERGKTLRQRSTSVGVLTLGPRSGMGRCRRRLLRC